MKNLKTIATALLLLFTFTSAFAQTEEETIEWLNRNGKELLKTNYVPEGMKGMYCKDRFDKIENGNIIFIREVSYNGSPYSKRISKIPITSILYEDVNTMLIKENSSLPDITKNILEATLFLNNVGYESIDIKEPQDGKKEIKTEKEIKAEKFIIYIKGENLEDAKRVLKAIMHLAKLSGAKENKQTF